MASILRFDNWQNSDGTSIATTDASGNISFAGSLGAVAGVGKILQVAQATSTTQQAFNTSTYTAVTDLNLSMTPQSSQSKFLLIMTLYITHLNTDKQSFATFYRGDPASSGIDVCGNRLLRTTETTGGSGDFHMSGSFLDSPSTTSETTYYVAFKTAGSNTNYINYSSAVSSLIVMEVGQ
jgi:hypothetical protein